MSRPICRVCEGPLGHPESLRLRLCAGCSDRLPLAALDMFEAIKAALKEPNDAAWDMLRAAIKKAEGK
jgi:hypothetical protein